MNLDLSKIKKVFFVGIGGIGISAIARMMLLEGKEVSGSDISMSGITDELQKLGAKIVSGQAMELIPEDVDLVVYSISIVKYDPEFFKKLQSSNIQILSYPETLGIVTANKYTIAVSGTHGKTTTTAMIAKVLIEAKKDPSVIVGSLLKESKSNLIVGKSEFFVVEACEYERSFLNIKPKILVITNIEADHLDYYKDIADIESAFSEMAMQTDNFIVCNPDDISVSHVLKKDSKGKYRAKIVDYGKYLEKVPQLSVPGVHNRMNSAAALAVADILNIKEEVAEKALSEFSGTWRRLEKKGITKEGAIIYDDYAHHPTEVRASLEALRELYPKGKKNIIILFQPHLYSRTKALFDEFVTCFDQADNVFLLPIFFARENPDPEVSSEILAVAIKNHKGEATAFKDFTAAEDYIGSLKLGENDIFVTMGAGEAYKVAEKVFKLT
ncbi:MAG: UDP-N-acetylmuramate--L-alanine ligase [Candidatus Paceibacterota bacterium]|jgi:UDP-N-acetylmuramate--alanine ligase